MDGVDFKSFDVKGAKMDTAQAIVFLRAYGAKVEV